MNIAARKAAAILVTLAVVAGPFASDMVPMAQADVVSLDCTGSLGTPTTFEQTIKNDPDSGTFGGNWAYDNFTRTIKIWTLDSTHYCAQATDDGHFVTFGDATGKSPESGAALPDTVTGTMIGGTGMVTVNGTLNDPVNIPSTIDCATDAATCAAGLTSGWMNAYFASGSTFVYPDWSWTYTAKNTCFGSWTNAAASNHGDIKDATNGHCPEALNQHLTTDAGVATSTTLTGHHSNVFSVSNLPAHGTLTCGDVACTIDAAFDPADVTFTPEAGFSGDTEFDFTASDGTYDNDATIYIHVNPAVIIVPPPTPTQTSNTVVVTPSAMQGWSFVDDQVGGAGTGALVTGPATAPLGTGSAQLTATSTTDGQILVAPYAGIKFADIASLLYSTYQAAPNTGNATAIALQFNVATTSTDTNAGWQGRIVYEPYVNNGGAVIAGSWNTWDAKAGLWWLTKPASFPGVTCDQGHPCSLATLVATYPNIGVNGNPTLGAVLFKAGSSWTNFSGNVDKLVIGVTTGSNTDTTTYDFEPAAAVTPPTGGGSGTPPAPVVTSGGNGGGGIVMGGPLGIGFVNTNIGGGLVLGTSTEDTSEAGCSTPLLTTYMRAGLRNSKSEVVKLQNFLNTELGLNIPATGFFGSQTTAGVNAFQIKYQSDVLSPWAPFGLNGTPTGYVYKTTQHQINKLACGNLNVPAPQLP